MKHSRFVIYRPAATTAVARSASVATSAVAATTAVIVVAGAVGVAALVVVQAVAIAADLHVLFAPAQSRAKLLETVDRPVPAGR